MLYLKCVGQVVTIDKDERMADRYINANTVHWEFCERWAGMDITAQFTQNGETYNVHVDEVTSTTTMPNEIEAGDVDISAFGEHLETGVRITAVPVKKRIEKSGFVGDGATPIPPTPDLYSQLLDNIYKGLNWRGEWDETRNYHRDDAVKYNGTSYIFVTDRAPEGMSPVDDPDSWHVIAEKGDKGDMGDPGKDGATAAEVIAAMQSETWVFTLEDGSTVSKEVPLV